MAALAALLALPAGANAVVTATNITAPSGDPVVVNPDSNAGTVPLEVSGTATAGPGDAVDIYCLVDNRDDPVPSSAPLAADVPVTGGTFSTTIDLNDFRYYICELVAWPSTLAPVDQAAFDGVVISNNGFTIERLSPMGGNAIFDYAQNTSARGGYWSVSSGGNCFVSDSYPVDEASLNYIDQMYGCSSISQKSAPDPVLTVDGQVVRLPYEQNSLAGLLGIQNFTNSVDAQGNLHVTSTEPAVLCDPSCDANAGDSGVRLEQRQDAGDNGHTMRILHRWTNTTGQAKQIVVPYLIELASSDTGWRFPGEPGLTARAEGATQPVPAGDGPASFLVSQNAPSTCTGLDDACGSVTWLDPPQSIEFVETDEARLTYSLTIPPNGSKLVAFSYSQGFPLAQVEGFARAAEAAFDTSISIDRIKKNKKKGTAKLLVDVPGAGVLNLAGKGLKPASRQAPSAGTAQLTLKPKGKAKKRLKRKGKTKVKAAITYTRTDLEPTTLTKQVKLKQKRKKRR